jgi:predicted aconitase
MPDMPEYRDETVNSIAQIWANKYLSSRRPLPVPTGEVDVREANAVDDAEKLLLELAKSAVAKLARDTAPPGKSPQQPTEDAIRDMAAAIATEILTADESQTRVDRTVLSNLQS